MARSARDFRNVAVQVNPGQELQPNQWYRSPLSKDDHMLGVKPEFMAEGIAWCGWDLITARDWDNEEYGGLWYSNRKSDSARCATCKSRQGEYDEFKKLY